MTEASQLVKGISMSHRFVGGKTTLALGLSAIMTVIGFGGLGAAIAAPTQQMVTICHATNSVTNPYQRITVSVSALDGELNVRSGGGTGSSSPGNHASDAHNKHSNANFPKVNGIPVRVFNPNYAYTPNTKMWEDIIPPFTVSDGNGGVAAGSYAGLNWSAAGQAIYFGTDGMAGYCTADDGGFS